MWQPDNLNEQLDGFTWEYTARDKHFWPPEDTVSNDAKLIIDLGANAGFSAGLLADNWKEAQVIAVEMNPETAERARDNTRSFDGRVKVITAAIGWPEREEIAIFTTASAVDHFKCYPHDEGVEYPLRVLSLDSLLKDIELDRQEIDFIKFDMEGAEWEVLNDGGDWSKRTKALSIENHYVDVDKVSSKLIELGFTPTRNNYGMLCGYKQALLAQLVDAPGLSPVQ